MKKDEIVQLCVQLDIKEAQKAIVSLKDAFDSLNESLKTIAQWDISSVAESLDVMAEKTTVLATQLGTLQADDSLLTTFSEVAGTIASLLTIEELIGKLDIFTKLSGLFGGLLNETLVPALESVSTGIAAIFGGSTIGGILGVVAVIGILIATILVLVDNIDYVKGRITTLWEDHIKPLGENIGRSLQSMGENLSILWNDFLMPLGEWLLEIFKPLGYTIVEAFLDAFDIVGINLAMFVEGVFDMLDGLIESITGIFTFDQEKSQIGMAKVFDGAYKILDATVTFLVNALIWICNTVSGLLYSALEGVANKLFDALNWVGSLFGQDWGLKAPPAFQIPYLAQGAVLPANRPFLAMVGDQKHGTNIEAPLTTIQEAVATVMADYEAANLAGHEATVEVLRQLLAAVLGIEVGDTTIGQAANRYNQKMAVIKGGL